MARLVKVLSVSTECKQALVEAGAVQVSFSILLALNNVEVEIVGLTDIRLRP